VSPDRTKMTFGKMPKVPCAPKEDSETMKKVGSDKAPVELPPSGLKHTCSFCGTLNAFDEDTDLSFGYVCYNCNNKQMTHQHRHSVDGSTQSTTSGTHSTAAPPRAATSAPRNVHVRASVPNAGAAGAARFGAARSNPFAHSTNPFSSDEEGGGGNARTSNVNGGGSNPFSSGSARTSTSSVSGSWAVPSQQGTSSASTAGAATNANGRGLTFQKMYTDSQNEVARGLEMAQSIAQTRWRQIREEVEVQMMLCEEREDSEYFTSLLKACGEGDDVKQLELVLDELRAAGIEVSSELDMLLRSLTSAEDNAAMWSYLKMGLDAEDRINIETFLEGLPPQEVMCTQMYLKMLESSERQLLNNMKFANSIKDAKRCKDLEALLNLQERARQDRALQLNFGLKLEKAVASICAANAPTTGAGDQTRHGGIFSENTTRQDSGQDDGDEDLRRAHRGRPVPGSSPSSSPPPRKEPAPAGPQGRSTHQRQPSPPQRQPTPRSQQQPSASPSGQQQPPPPPKEEKRSQPFSAPPRGSNGAQSSHTASQPPPPPPRQGAKQPSPKPPPSREKTREEKREQYKTSTPRPAWAGKGPRKNDIPQSQWQKQQSQWQQQSQQNSSSRSSKPPKTQASRIDALRVLGFAPTDRPTMQQLKAAYRKGALQWHPDRAQNHHNADLATEKFQGIKSAFDMLQS